MENVTPLQTTQLELSTTQESATPLPKLSKLPSPTLLTDQKPSTTSSLILQVELLHASAEDLDLSREELERHLDLIASSGRNLEALKNRLLSLRALITNDLLQVEKLLQASNALHAKTSINHHIATKGVTKVKISTQNFHGLGEALRPTTRSKREPQKLKGPRGSNNHLTPNERRLAKLLKENPALLAELQNSKS